MAAPTNPPQGLSQISGLQIGYNGDSTAPERTPTGSTFVGVNTIKKTISGSTATSGQILAVANNEGQSIIITRATLDVTTGASAACVLDIGTAASATTSSDNLIDGISVNTASALYDNINQAGSNGKASQKQTTSQYVTVTVASGNATGLVANLYVDYRLTTPGS